MFRAPCAFAALALLAAFPAVAQDLGGIPLSGQERLLNTIESRAPGCQLSKTNVLIGINRSAATGSQAQQQLASTSGGCRPLVSTQVVAGANLALGQGSAADQTLVGRAPRGLLGTANFARGVNIAVGGRSAATQGILAQIGQ